ncbi:MAG: tetratricopeptide repeat protein [Mangrovicoccus sp.]|nr:tetratricopeptide repeat protein [Mangrovicoccus sp.]
MRRVFLTLCVALIGLPVLAQDRAATLADMRRELTALRVELQQLRGELSAGSAGGEVAVADATGPLERLDGLEAQVRGLTAQTEELAYRIDQIVRDGTNRLGDLEFRLVELEGGDLGQISETPVLGGGALPEPGGSLPKPRPGSEAEAPVQFAMAETNDFEAGMSLLDQGDHAGALSALDRFLATYPGSPLSAEVHMLRGAALRDLNRLPDAGRAYLEAYTLAEKTDPALSADGLVSLGEVLGDLNQTTEACLTLGQAIASFPGTAAAERAGQRRAAMNCFE